MWLQEFMHHVLKNCMVVLVTARDEASCFKVFSSLNGRGIDLAVVDKLKPELMQVWPWFGARMRPHAAGGAAARSSGAPRPCG